MARTKADRSSSKGSERAHGDASRKSPTVQRTYRFDTKTFEAFEEDCARYLSNPKRVIEALILHWLDAGADARAAMAKKHIASVSGRQPTRIEIGPASIDEASTQAWRPAFHRRTAGTPSLGSLLRSSPGIA
jgi:hypothetical protein